MSAVRTGDERVGGDAFVLSAGAFSRPLTDRLGLGLPLDTERGYHVTCPDPGVTVSHTVMEADHKFVANPMAMGVRFAGMVEMAGFDAPANPRRAEVIQAAREAHVPEAPARGRDPSGWVAARACRTDSR